MRLCITGEPPNNGHIGDRSLVLCREVVPISEVVLVPSKKDPPALVPTPAVQRAQGASVVRLGTRLRLPDAL